MERKKKRKVKSRIGDTPIVYQGGWHKRENERRGARLREEKEREYFRVLLARRN